MCYKGRLNRLDDVLERHQRRTKQARERIAWIAIVSGLLVIVVVLLIFTDLGKPPVPVRAAAPAAPATERGSGQRVDGVLLGAPKRAAPPAKPTRP